MMDPITEHFANFHKGWFSDLFKLLVIISVVYLAYGGWF